MKLLVLGGTVFLSRAVAALGVRRGHEVTVAARGSSGEPPDGARFVKTDRATTDGLDALRGQDFDAVVDVARLPAHVGSALDALADRTRHWTFVSSGSVYADQCTPRQTTHAPLLEPAAPDSTDPAPSLYGNSKVACEALVRERIGDRAMTIRAGLIVGPHDPSDRFGYWPLRIVDGGEVLAPGAPADDVQFVDVRDLARWIVDAAENGTTGTYDGACPPMSREAFLTGIAEAVGRRPEFTWVPHEFLREHGVNPWAGDDSLGLWLPLPEYGGFLSRDTGASVTAGLKIRSLADTVAHYLSETGNARPALLADLPRAREAEVLAAWHAAGTAPERRVSGPPGSTCPTAKAHRRSFDEAPRVRAGDVVRFLRLDAENPGWFLGRAGGQEGYFPVAWFDLSPDRSSASARRDYDAMELTIEAGVEVQCLEAEGPWVLVRTASGDEGWIPRDCVDRKEADP